MVEDVPKIIKENCLDFDWNNEEVWKIPAPVETMKVSELVWQFDFPFWHSSKKRYVITPNQVIKDPEKYNEQYDRIMDADLKYPMEIMKNQKEKWEILDGLHRFTKAFLLGYKEVNVRKIPPSEMDKIKF